MLSLYLINVISSCSREFCICNLLRFSLFFFSINQYTFILISHVFTISPGKFISPQSQSVFKYPFKVY